MRTPALCLAILACALVPCAARAEFQPPRHETIHSAALGVDRAIDVWLPVDDANGARYDTLYVLDGDWNAKVVLQAVEFTQSVGLMPKVVVVGVPNRIAEGINSRDSDLTPTVVADEPRSGGADRFLAFLRDELVPHIDAHYPTNRHHAVHGHSYGGLFLAYALIHSPDLFADVALLDPAMWWDDATLVEPLGRRLAVLAPSGRTLYVAGRSGEAFAGMGVDRLERVLQRDAPATLHWTLQSYPAETHDSLKLKATYDALRHAYQGYGSEHVNLVPERGVAVPGHPIRLGGLEDRFPVRWTSDGSQPGAASPLAANAPVEEAWNVRARVVSNSGRFDHELEFAFERGSWFASPRTRAATAAAAWTVGFVPSWPPARRLPSMRPIDGDTLALPGDTRASIAGVAQRSVLAAEDGYYLVALNSSERLRLWIDGHRVLDHDGSGGRRQRTYLAPLAAGRHEVRIDFERTARDRPIDVTVLAYGDGSGQWWKSPRTSLEIR